VIHLSPIGQHYFPNISESLNITKTELAFKQSVDPASVQTRYCVAVLTRNVPSRWDQSLSNRMALAKVLGLAIRVLAEPFKRRGGNDKIPRSADRMND
jgi:hypothetical protein